MPPRAAREIPSSDPGPHKHTRAEIRIEVEAGAVYTLANGSLPLGLRRPRLRLRPRTLGYGHVRNISAGGVEIMDPQPNLCVGSKIKVGIVSSDVKLGPFWAQVVRETECGIALRFLDVDTAVRREILKEIARL